jgi:hypothetical protein
LFPLQVTPTAKLEWGYRDNEEWKIVDKVAVPDGIEKLIGFEGIGDPATGFYCVSRDNNNGIFFLALRKSLIILFF